MTTAAQAFGPGSPAGGVSAVAKLASLPSTVPGLPSIPSLAQSSSATGESTAGFDNSGFVVNYGSGGANGLPQWVILAGLALAGWAVVKRGKA